MKVCPQCNEKYTDESLNFCLNDGASLTVISDNQPETVLLNQPRNTAPNQQFGTFPPQPSNTAPNQQFGTAPQNFGNNPVNQPRKSSKAWVWVLLILGGVIILCGGGFAGFLIYVANQADTTSTSSSTKKSSVTLDKFNRIKDGMSYRDVAGIIGSEGEQTTYSGSVVTYKWDGGEFQLIICVFSNDKLTYKTQANLK